MVDQYTEALNDLKLSSIAPSRAAANVQRDVEAVEARTLEVVDPEGLAKRADQDVGARTGLLFAAPAARAQGADAVGVVDDHHDVDVDPDARRSARLRMPLLREERPHLIQRELTRVLAERSATRY